MCVFSVEGSYVAAMFLHLFHQKYVKPAVSGRKKKDVKADGFVVVADSAERSVILAS